MQEKRQNFITIAGITDSETKISNIWAYFLQADSGHKMGARVLNSLIKVINKVRSSKNAELKINQYTESDLKELEVIREVYSKKNEKGNYADIVIIHHDFFLVLENKINHFIKDNNMKEYKKHAASMFFRKYGNPPEIILAGYLTRYPVSFEQKVNLSSNYKDSQGDFYITYDEVFKEILVEEKSNRKIDIEEIPDIYFRDFYEEESMEEKIKKNLHMANKLVSRIKKVYYK